MKLNRKTIQNLFKHRFKKGKGTSSMILPSLMLILIVLILLLMTFRISMINTMYNYIDDALVSSVLGGALLNVEEYGRSNQMIIYSNEDWVEVRDLHPETSTYMGWTKNEADILLSNLNDGSDIELSYSELDPKLILNPESYRSDGIRADMSDEYLARCYSAFISNLKYNLSNGAVQDAYGQSGTVNYSFKNLTSDATTIGRDVINNSFLRDFIIGNMYVTRFEVYNVYRQDTAKENKYVPYTGFDSYGEATITGTGNAALDGKKFFDLSDANKQLYLDNFATDTFVARYERYLRAQEIEESLMTDVCYTDTQTTWQSGATSDRPVSDFKFAFKPDWDVTYASMPTINRNGEEALRTGYSRFRYEGVADPLTGSNSGNSTSQFFELSESNQDIVIDSGKMAGVEIENTAVYVELTLTVGTFPPDITDEAFEAYNNHEDYIASDGDVIKTATTVTISRLIDIELAE